MSIVYRRPSFLLCLGESSDLEKVPQERNRQRRRQRAQDQGGN